MQEGRVGGSVGEVSDFGSGHDVTVRDFEPHMGLSVVSAQGPFQILCPPVSLPLPRLLLTLSPSKVNIKKKKKVTCV